MTKSGRLKRWAGPRGGGASGRSEVAKRQRVDDEGADGAKDGDVASDVTSMPSSDSDIDWQPRSDADLSGSEEDVSRTVTSSGEVSESELRLKSRIRGSVGVTSKLNSITIFQQNSDDSGGDHVDDEDVDDEDVDDDDDVDDEDVGEDPTLRRLRRHRGGLHDAGVAGGSPRAMPRVDLPRHFGRTRRRKRRGNGSSGSRSSSSSLGMEGSDLDDFLLGVGLENRGEGGAADEVKRTRILNVQRRKRRKRRKMRDGGLFAPVEKRGRKQNRPTAARRTEMTDEVKELLHRANDNYLDGDITAAVELLKEVIRRAPGLHDPFHTLGIIYENEFNDLPRAVEFYLLAAHLVPRDVNLWKRVGKMAEDINDAQTAIYCYKRCLRNTAGLRTGLVDTAEGVSVDTAAPDTQKNDPEGGDVEDEIQEAMPLDEEVVYSLSMCLLRKRDYRGACERLRLLFDRHPEDMHIVNLLIDAYRSLRLWQKAIEVLEVLCLRSSPSSASAVVKDNVVDDADHTSDSRKLEGLPYGQVSLDALQMLADLYTDTMQHLKCKTVLESVFDGIPVADIPLYFAAKLAIVTAFLSIEAFDGQTDLRSDFAWQKSTAALPVNSAQLPDSCEVAIKRLSEAAEEAISVSKSQMEVHAAVVAGQSDGPMATAKKTEGTLDAEKTSKKTAMFITESTKSLSIPVKTDKLLVEMGEALLISNRPHRALELLRKFSEIRNAPSSKRVTVWTTLAQCLCRVGEWEQAASVLRWALGSSPPVSEAARDAEVRALIGLRDDNRPPSKLGGESASLHVTEALVIYCRVLTKLGRTEELDKALLALPSYKDIKNASLLPNCMSYSSRVEYISRLVHDFALRFPEAVSKEQPSIASRTSASWIAGERPGSAAGERARRHGRIENVDNFLEPLGPDDDLINLDESSATSSAENAGKSAAWLMLPGWCRNASSRMSGRAMLLRRVRNRSGEIARQEEETISAKKEWGMRFLHIVRESELDHQRVSKHVALRMEKLRKDRRRRSGCATPDEIGQQVGSEGNLLEDGTNDPVTAEKLIVAEAEEASGSGKPQIASFSSRSLMGGQSESAAARVGWAVHNRGPLWKYREELGLYSLEDILGWQGYERFLKKGFCALAQLDKHADAVTMLDTILVNRQMHRVLVYTSPKKIFKRRMKSLALALAMDGHLFRLALSNQRTRYVRSPASAKGYRALESFGEVLFNGDFGRNFSRVNCASEAREVLYENRSWVVRQLLQNPQSFPLTMMVGHFCAMSGRWHQAVAEYSRVHRMMPRDELACLCLAVSYLSFSTSRMVKDRHAIIMRAFAVLSKYVELRKSSAEAAAALLPSFVNPLNPPASGNRATPYIGRQPSPTLIALENHLASSPRRVLSGTPAVAESDLQDLSRLLSCSVPSEVATHSDTDSAFGLAAPALATRGEAPATVRVLTSEEVHALQTVGYFRAEVVYNLGRAYHLLGLTHLSAPLYAKTLRFLDEAYPLESTDEIKQATRARGVGAVITRFTDVAQLRRSAVHNLGRVIAPEVDFVGPQEVQGQMCRALCNEYFHWG